jgi:hypothetical protein
MFEQYTMATVTPLHTICAFDLGIKNLSFCVASFDGSGGLVAVRRWANLNLLADGAEAQTQTRCSFVGCGGPASWRMPGGGLLCKRCVSKGRSGGVIPLELLATGAKFGVAELRGWAIEHLTEISSGELTVAGVRALKKPALMELAATHRLMPYKAAKAKGASLQAVLAGMDTALDVELPTIAAASRIRIENQPSEFAPHMKSVQMMLFALLTHRLQREHGWTGSIEFANASVKTRGAGIAAGKENKKDRKAAGIAKVAMVLGAAGTAAAEHLTWWSAQAKKDDLADAFLMCLDTVN